MTRSRMALSLVLGTASLWVGAALAQEILPFPEPPSASVAGRTLEESTHQWRTEPRRLPEDAPNIVIFMTDDAGFSNPEVFGGPVHMPTLAKLAAEGIADNAFHTTAMCSPTRAALLTGRNHHRVGYGNIAELAADWDGYYGGGRVRGPFRRGLGSREFYDLGQEYSQAHDVAPEKPEKLRQVTLLEKGRAAQRVSFGLFFNF